MSARLFFEVESYDYKVGVSVLILIFLLNYGCGTTPYHVVRHGDTLYAIGWKYGYDHRLLANWNNIPPPFSISEGQKIRLAPPHYTPNKQRLQSKISNKVNKASRANVIDLSEPIRLKPVAVQPNKERTTSNEKRVGRGSSGLKNATAVKQSVLVKQSILVKQGDTLFSIASNSGLDYKKLARWNSIIPPYLLKEGQEISLIAPTKNQPLKSAKNVVSKNAVLSVDKLKTSVQKTAKQTRINKISTSTIGSRKHTKTSISLTKRISLTKPKWQWPAEGKIVKKFAANDSIKKGIKIAGKSGQPILAAANGEIVYSGSGLIGYGKLIIIKHNEHFLSAYAHNRRLLVREGERVTSGQHIAEMGKTGIGKVMLHFEVRRDGKSVDPLYYLPTRRSN